MRILFLFASVIQKQTDTNGYKNGCTTICRTTYTLHRQI